MCSGSTSLKILLSQLASRCENLQLLCYLFAVKESRKQSTWVESWKATKGEEGELFTLLGVATSLPLVVFFSFITSS